jgi:Coenzyme PQQ synthesis protein D (PqqD)
MATMTNTQSPLITNGSIVSAVTHQVSCDLAGEAVILNLQDGVYYGLNTVGARIWQLLEQPRSVEQIHAVLLGEYDIDLDTCVRQVAAILSELDGHGLLDVR